MLDIRISKSINLTFALARVIFTAELFRDNAGSNSIHRYIKLVRYYRRLYFTRILLCIGKSSKALFLLLPQVMKLLLQFSVNVSAELYLLLQFNRLGFHNFILLRQSLEFIGLLYQLGSNGTPALLQKFGFLLVDQILDIFLLFHQSLETFLKLLSFIIKNHSRHGFQVLLIAFLAKKSFGLIFEFSLSYQAFFACVVSTYSAPRLIAGQFFEAYATKITLFLLLFLDFLSLAVEDFEQLFGFGYVILFLIGLFEGEKFNEFFFDVADLVNGQYFAADVFLGIVDKAPLIFVYHLVLIQL